MRRILYLFAFDDNIQKIQHFTHVLYIGMYFECMLLILVPIHYQLVVSSVFFIL